MRIARLCFNLVLGALLSAVTVPEVVAETTTGLPPIAGRWRMEMHFDRAPAGVSPRARETWEIRTDDNRLSIVRLGMMMLPEEDWRRDPVRIEAVVLRPGAIQFKADGQVFTLTIDGDRMAGTFSAAPSSALSGGRVTFDRTVAFESAELAHAALAAGAKQALVGMWELVSRTQATTARQVEVPGRTPGRTREFWEIAMSEDGLTVVSVTGTIHPPEMWRREVLPVKQFTFDGHKLSILIERNAVRRELAVAIDGDGGRGTFWQVDDSLWPHAPAIRGAGHVEMVRIPDFAVHLSRDGDGFADTVRRHAALRERANRGDKAALGQLTQEIGSFQRGMKFLTGQSALEVKRIEASNARRAAVLADIYKQQAIEARLQADAIYQQAGRETSKSAALRGMAETLDQSAKDLTR